MVVLVVGEGEYPIYLPVDDGCPRWPCGLFKNGESLYNSFILVFKGLDLIVKDNKVSRVGLDAVFKGGEALFNVLQPAIFPFGIILENSSVSGHHFSKFCQ